jgi:hypothetical protein
LSAFFPDAIAERAIKPFAGGFVRANDEERNGVSAVRYDLTESGRAAYAAATALKGQINGSVWIAKSGGYLVSASIKGEGDPVPQPSGGSWQDGFTLQLDITRANDPLNVVEAPVLPQPDATTPAGNPVDLRLEFDVLPAGATAPTAEDAAQIANSMRRRLDTDHRPIWVEENGTRLTVIDCRTTTADGDRQLAVTPGLLSVVPLPPGDFGTLPAPGPTGLPVAGASIDPNLIALPYPGRAGSIHPHVDPSTGRRGLALTLDNRAANGFREWSAAHTNEFFAVVLDGSILSVLSVEGRSAEGRFVFTGPYTSEDVAQLVRELESTPLAFPLKLVKESRGPAA